MMRTDSGFTARPSSPFCVDTIESRIQEIERLAREARDLAAGQSPGSAGGKLTAERARTALLETSAALTRLEALRERVLTAGDLAAEIRRQHEGRAA